MNIREKSTTGLLTAVLLLALAGGTALAQQPPAPPKPALPRPTPAQHVPPPATQGQAAPAGPADQTPQRTTASYGDWTVRCEVVPGPPAQKNCEMDQLAQMQGQPNPISRVWIPLTPKGEPPKLFVAVPTNVSFTAPLKLTADAKDAGISSPFRRCVPGGCLVEIELKDDLQRKFRGAAAEPGKITYKNAGDQEVTIPVSFKGFAQAYEALLKQ
jgi:invasion protein IalB